MPRYSARRIGEKCKADCLSHDVFFCLADLPNCDGAVGWVEHSETHHLVRQEAILMGFVSLNPSYPLRRLASARPRERTAFFRLCGANRSGIIMLPDSHCMLFPI